MSTFSHIRNRLTFAFRRLSPFVLELGPLGIFSVMLQVSLLVTIAGSLLFGHMPFVGSFVLSNFLFVVVLCMLQRRCDRLDERAFLEKNAPRWMVSANGVEIGTISDSDYAGIRRQLLANGRVHARQLFSTLMAIGRAFSSLLLEIPVVVFWLIVGSALIWPASFQSTMDQMAHYSMHDVLSLLPHLRHALGLLVMFILVSKMVTGHQFGCVNVFELETKDYVRRKIASPLTGEIEIWRMDGEKKVHVIDEFRTLMRGRGV